MINSLIYTLVFFFSVSNESFVSHYWMDSKSSYNDKTQTCSLSTKKIIILISILFLFPLIFVLFLHVWLEPLYVERNFAHVISCTSCACSIKCVQYCALFGVVLHTQIVSTCHVWYVQYYKLCIHHHVFGICYHRPIRHDHAQSCTVQKECILW